MAVSQFVWTHRCLETEAEDDSLSDVAVEFDSDGNEVPDLMDSCSDADAKLWSELMAESDVSDDELAHALQDLDADGYHDHDAFAVQDPYADLDGAVPDDGLAVQDPYQDPYAVSDGAVPDAGDAQVPDDKVADNTGSNVSAKKRGSEWFPVRRIS